MIVNLTRIRAIVTNAKSALAHAVNRNPVGQEAADFGIAAAGLVVVEEAMTELERKHGKFLNDSPVTVVPPGPPPGMLCDDAKLLVVLDELLKSGGSIHYEEQHEYPRTGIELHRGPAFILLSKTGDLEACQATMTEALAQLLEAKMRKP